MYLFRSSKHQWLATIVLCLTSLQPGESLADDPRIELSLASRWAHVLVAPENEAASRPGYVTARVDIGTALHSSGQHTSTLHLEAICEGKETADIVRISDRDHAVNLPTQTDWPPPVYVELWWDGRIGRKLAPPQAYGCRIRAVVERAARRWRSAPLDASIEVLQPPTAIADVALNGHSLALDSEGRVWGAGYTLGNGTGEVTAWPSPVSLPTGMTQIAAGSYFGLSLDDTGVMWTWGSNQNQPGINAQHPNTMPTPKSDLGPIRTMAAGSDYWLALSSDGSLWGHGYNAYGQLGDVTVIGSQTEEPMIVAEEMNFVAISAGHSHVLALDPAGNLWGWGDNARGQLGPLNTGMVLAPTRLPIDLQASKVQAGDGFSMAMTQDGRAWAWGQGTAGQLGNGLGENSAAPVQVSVPSPVVDISAGGWVGMATDSSGSVWAWGGGSFGTLGNGSAAFALSPVEASVPTTALKAKTSGFSSMAIDTSGYVWGWGSDRSQLGDGDPDEEITPQAMLLPGSDWRFATGSKHVVALDETGNVWAWGVNGFGQLGTGSAVSTGVPTKVGGIPHAIDIAAGSAHSLAVAAGGEVWAWGEGKWGALGDGTTSTKSQPVRVYQLDDVERVAAGDVHSLAVDESGQVWAWGTNTRGQLGLGSTTSYSYPIPTDLHGVQDVVARSYHSFALDKKGYVWAWGANPDGVLGDGTTLSRNSPAQVGGLTAIVALASGSEYAAALDRDGRLFTWGSNGHGQLGDPLRESGDTPQAVNLPYPVVTFTTGQTHMLALDSEGNLWGWGADLDGLLATVSNSFVYEPTVLETVDLMTPEGPFAQPCNIICAGNQLSILITATGSGVSFGNSLYGELGDGTHGLFPGPTNFVGQSGL